MENFPAPVQSMLKKASQVVPETAFRCRVFGSPWDGFVELWLPRIYTFVEEALGPYHKEPLREIIKLPDGLHSAGATASFHPGTGQITISTSVEGLPGQTLEKLTHELIHASLAGFPEGDEFYEEGQVDYATWVLAHAPVWGEHRQAMIDAAAYNIACRRDRALKDLCDYDRKRWAGGVYASIAYGPWIINRLRMKKLEGDLTW